MRTTITRQQLCTLFDNVFGEFKIRVDRIDDPVYRFALEHIDFNEYFERVCGQYEWGEIMAGLFAAGYAMGAAGREVEMLKSLLLKEPKHAKGARNRKDPT